MISETFGQFFKKRRKRGPNLPNGDALWDEHDQHRDAVMHHLYELHKLTHPKSQYNRVLNKLGIANKHVHELHGTISHAIHEHGDSSTEE